MNGEPPIRVLAAEGFPLLRAGMAAAIAAEPDLELVGETSDAADALELHRLLRPDVTVLDVRLNGHPPVEAVRAIVTEFPRSRVIAVSVTDGDEHVRRLLDGGARGFLRKDAPRAELVEAIRTVHRGGRAIPAPVAARLAEAGARTALTPREREVLALMAEGMSNKQIAVRLHRTEGTVKIHVKNILAKMAARDRTQAVVRALRRGVLSLH